ncbi:sulfide-quinone oxidoreductase [Cylindrobasidium torrendii FP15055 ss-10]|uniref:Sulfide:quinone oxidoreductase, mitochondrial n=1 Tax=Cylindrobasidium torrendii FP15055 ss-10 TaxID=1314674 RepID=A0A0D7B5M9_9AGAR|nr:sulfide-quinone oxidoreductase [Cylindrobasidium torrendii FP15055 ss-10]
MLAARTLARPAVPRIRLASTIAHAAAAKDKYRVVVVGAGSGGLSVARQIYTRFKKQGQALNDGDIAIIDPAEYHYYQPGWTLVGSGLANKAEFRHPLAPLVPKHFTFISDGVETFQPASSSITTHAGRSLSYDALVVAPGLKINWDAVTGLPEALADPTSGVSSIYSYATCDKVWNDVEALRSGKAIFTQPAGVIKCPGAPQKIMWMSRDRFKHTARLEDIKVDFYTGMPTMFSVKKYSDALNAMRGERHVGGHFEHNLSAVDTNNRVATFKTPDGSDVKTEFDFLHVAPPMGPLDFVKNSPLADKAGWVSVDPGTLQHTKFANVFSLGDCANVPTAKTAAAITAQAPVLTENLVSLVSTGKIAKAVYNGYASCPLLTGYGELMLAEFKYPFVPDETFPWMNQSKPNRIFYHLKKDLFPAAYWNLMVNGQWFGRRAIFRPSFT